MKWVTITGFSNYEVSEYGHLRNKNTGRILKVHLNKGYLTCSLNKNGKKYPFRVHRLVATSFIKKSNLQVNHKDFNKTNNHYTNLEFVTNLENARHATKFRIPAQRPKKTGTRFTGVSRDKTIKLTSKCWVAYINYRKKRTVIGYFHHAVEAAKAYNIEARKLYGMGAYQNEILGKEL